mmetsp:Transcript_92878/g.194113  ORF Transcript_92878/g.194113 Transcript_92878/m.194113 type:complete len:363 (+) Transcript_92878:113-1201(+)
MTTTTTTTTTKTTRVATLLPSSRASKGALHKSPRFDVASSHTASISHSHVVVGGPALQLSDEARPLAGAIVGVVPGGHHVLVLLDEGGGRWGQLRALISASHTERHDLHVAGLLNVLRDEEGLRRVAAHCIETVVVQEHRTFAIAEATAEGVGEGVLVGEVIGLAGDLTVEEEGSLTQGLQPVLQSANCHHGQRMDVQDCLDVRAELHDFDRHGDAAHVAAAGLRHLLRAVEVDEVAVEVILQHRGGRLLLEEETPLSHQELLAARDSVHDALRCEVGTHIVDVEESIQGGRFCASLPLDVVDTDGVLASGVLRADRGDRVQLASVGCVGGHRHLHIVAVERGAIGWILGAIRDGVDSGGRR